MTASTGIASAQPGHHSALLARSGRTVYLREYATLSFVSEEETTLFERGSAWGTFPGPVSVIVKLSPKHVDAEFVVHPRGGSVTGRASARYVYKGSLLYYGGTMKIVKGTGLYRHASGTNIGISGTLARRENFKLTVKANGWVRY